MNENIWERQQDEGDAAWAGFQAYLLSSPRSIENTAKQVQKSPKTLRNWAARYDWRRRATAFDADALEEARRELRRKLSTSFLKRWKDLDELAAMAADTLRTKIQQASPRTLAEILEMASEKQLSMVDKLKILDETDADDQTLTINIVAAGETVDLQDKSQILTA